MIFKQLFDQETWTYTYLIADPFTKEAVLIDPVNTHIEAYITLLAAHGLQLKYTLETHVHADHLYRLHLFAISHPCTQVESY